MFNAITIVCLVGLAGVATADGPGVAAADGPAVATADGLAKAHARSSATLYLASPWSPGPMVPIRIGVEGALRIHHSHFAVEARLGVGTAASIMAFTGQVSGHAGGALGLAFSAGERVVISPMVAYDVFSTWEDGNASVVIHYASLEVPVAIIIGRRVVLEPFLQVGVARFRGTNDPVIVIGPRIGIIL
ncbi:MAG: hypothetical protein JWO36_4969 [Myxococcales bacterium]|nr:hypothetical protein [Myxococcales bacterium]